MLLLLAIAKKGLRTSAYTEQLQIKCLHAENCFNIIINVHVHVFTMLATICSLYHVSLMFYSCSLNIGLYMHNLPIKIILLLMSV